MGAHSLCFHMSVSLSRAGEQQIMIVEDFGTLYCYIPTAHIDMKAFLLSVFRLYVTTNVCLF